MSWRNLTFEKFIYLALLIAGIFLRLVNLGGLPLNEVEAGNALIAANDEMPDWQIATDQPGYIGVTSALFYVFGSGNFLARFWPALVGSLLIISPYFFRKQLGQKEALVFAGLLMLDPAGLAISRQATGAILSVTGFVFFLGCVISEHPGWAGFWLGLGLLGGPAGWVGMMVLILFGVVSRVWFGPDSLEKALQLFKNGWKQIAVFCIGCVVLLSTFVLVQPHGLDAFGGSIASFFKGFNPVEVESLWVILLMLLVYYPSGIILGLWQGLQGSFKKDTSDRWLLAAVAVSLLVILIYPSRQISDLIWISFPLWALTSRKLVRLIHDVQSETLSVLSQAGLIVILLGFTWLNFVSYARVLTFDPASAEKRLLAMLISMLLVIAISVLVGWGWSWKIALKGFTIGLSMILLLYGVGTGVRAAGLGANPCNEPWRVSPCFSQRDVLIKTLEDVSEWNVLSKNGANLVVDVPSNMLRWELRNFPNVQFGSEAPSTDQSMVIISEENEHQDLVDSYVGQDFVLTGEPDWTGLLTNNISMWVTLREIPQINRLIVVWIHNNYMLGSANTNP